MRDVEFESSWLSISSPEAVAKRSFSSEGSLAFLGGVGAGSGLFEAFAQHESQQRPAPHMGGIESLKLLAEWRGREISVEAAEAYECMRFVI